MTKNQYHRECIKLNLKFQNLIRTSLVFVFICLFNIITNGQKNSNLLLDKYIYELINCPSYGDGMSRQEVAIADSVKSFGAKAIPKLIELLKNRDFKVRERASFILNTIDGINESHLDALIESLKRGQSWHASRIAEIGTPKALEALSEELVKECETQTQITYSFEILGEKGVPYLYRIIDCNNKCNEDLLYVVSTIFKELGSKAQSIVFKLDSLALSPTKSMITRRWAIICLGNIGITANQTAKDIYKLSTIDPKNFKKVAIDALQNMQSPYSVNLLIDRLSKSNYANDKILVLRDIAEMGKIANSAGPSILPYLKNDNWDVQIAAAMTLGYIDFKPATDGLIEALNFEPNCKLNYVSALALGKLKSKSALEHLQKVEKNHWYPPVKEAAKNAIKQISDPTFILKPKREYAFPEMYFSYENFGLGIPCCTLDQCTDEQKLNLHTGILIGTDNGEFGGELKYINTSGKETVILHDQIKSLYKINDKIIAIVGLAHLSGNYGSIYQIIENEDNSIVAKLILILPGAPFESKKNPNGGIWINTNSGTIELTHDLKLKFCDCYQKSISQIFQK